MSGLVLLNRNRLVIPILVSSNYADSQESPPVLLVCRRSPKGSAVSLHGRSPPSSFFLFSSEDPVCCLVQEVPTVRGFPRATVGKTSECPGWSPGLRSQQARQEADFLLFFVHFVFTILLLSVWGDRSQQVIERMRAT